MRGTKHKSDADADASAAETRAREAEEAEEARLRVELFKTQLEDMARRAAEHEEELHRRSWAKNHNVI